MEKLVLDMESAMEMGHEQVLESANVIKASRSMNTCPFIFYARDFMFVQGKTCSKCKSGL